MILFTILVNHLIPHFPSLKTASMYRANWSYLFKACFLSSYLFVLNLKLILLGTNHWTKTWLC